MLNLKKSFCGVSDIWTCRSERVKEFIEIPNFPHKKAEKEKIIYPDGSIYEGDLTNGKRKGNGVLTLKTGEIYKSEWIDDIMLPIVEIIDPSGTEKYKGEVQGLQKHGKGVLTNGEIMYEGFWSDNKRHGYGKEVHRESIYEGNWMNGNKHGAGILRYKDGSIFEGEWFEGQVRGFATLRQRNGDVYKGEWTELNSGSGVIDFENGDGFIGSWRLAGNEKNEENEMKEILSFNEDGKFFKKRGEREGVLVMANGVSIQGKWINDKIQVDVPVDF